MRNWLALPDQRLGDFPKTAANSHVMRAFGRASLFAVGEVLPAYSFNFERGCQIERRLCSLLDTYAYHGVGQGGEEVDLLRFWRGLKQGN